MRVRDELLTATAVCAIMLASTAANAANAPNAAGDSAAEPAQAPDEAAAPADASTADIVVTARRRDERLQDVPLSVAVLTGGDLATKGVQQTTDLQYVTPSVKFAPVAGRTNNSSYEIRGISTSESLITQDPATGIYVNEVYRARATGTNQSFYDIENVQILYGPQGTLFGRNSTAGAVLVTTKKPVFDFGADISAGIGNYNRYEVTGILNVPLGSTAAIRVAGQRIKRDGYGTDITSGNDVADRNSWSARASLLWEPTKGISNLTVFSYFKARERQALNVLYNVRACTPAALPFPNNILAGSPPGSCLYSPTGNAIVRQGDLTAALAAQRARGPYNVAYDPGENIFDRPMTLGVSNMTTIDVGGGITLKNIFGFNRVKYLTNTDLDGTPLKIIETFLDSRVNQYSDEFQVLGESSNFNWVAGGLVFHERGRDIQISTQLANLNPTNPQKLDTLGTNDSYALFASGTYKITPELSLTAGGRYSWDKRKVRYNPENRYGLATQSCVLSTVDYPGCVAKFSKSYHKPTYTVSLDYKVTPDILLYAVTRQGYRSGGFNARATNAAQFAPFRPETVRDVEGGFKGTFRFGNGASARTDLAVYQAWYDDIQRVVAFDPDGAGPQPQTTNILNAAKATIKGFELNIGVTPVRGFELSGFWGHVKAKYKSFTTNGVTLNDLPFGGSPNSYGMTAALTPVNDAATGRLTFAITYSLRDPFYGDLSAPIREPESRVPTQQLVNTSIDWNNILGSNFRAQAWVRNATNEKSILGTLATASSLGISVAQYGEPRTYGLTLGYRF